MFNTNKLTQPQLDQIVKLQAAISDFLDFLATEPSGVRLDFLAKAMAHAKIYQSYRYLYDLDTVAVEMIGSLYAYKDDLLNLMGSMEVPE